MCLARLALFHSLSLSPSFSLCLPVQADEDGMRRRKREKNTVEQEHEEKGEEVLVLVTSNYMLGRNRLLSLGL